MLKRGMIQVLFEPADATVPEDFKRQKHLMLEFGYVMPIPIPDLALDDHGISGTLSFPGRRPMWCMVPWTCVLEVQLAYEAADSAPAPKPPPRKIPAGWAVLKGGKA